MGISYVFPSEKLLELVPADCDTVQKTRDFIKKWVTEYIAMRRNPKTYKKLTDGSWDIDVLNDMMFSFWVLTPVETTHPQKNALKEKGIIYKCNCPNFAHYYTCKHCLAVGLWKKEITVPTRFSTTTVGKRKAPAGASLMKRTKCMVID